MPAVALASDLGVSTLLRFLARAGFTTFDKSPSYYGLGVTLGNAEVRLDELAAAYSAFARGGVWKRPTAVRLHVEESVGGEDRPGQENRELVSPRTAFLITDVLSDSAAREYAFGRGSYLDFPFAVAVKTGTSQAYHDNWTVGYTRDVTVGVWVGNFDRQRLRNSSGVTGAGPIFHAVMLAATRGRPSATAVSILPPPQGLEQISICALSGMRANPWCPSRMREWAVDDGDAVPCAWHHQSEQGVLTFYPPEYRAWASSEAAPSAPSAPAPIAPSAPVAPAPIAPNAPVAPPAPLRISSPPAGAVYSVDPTLRREFQALPLRAVTGRPTTVTWSIDGTAFGRTSTDRALSWPLAVGAHEIEVRDDEGRRARTSVVVK